MVATFLCPLFTNPFARHVKGGYFGCSLFVVFTHTAEQSNNNLKNTQCDCTFWPFLHAVKNNHRNMQTECDNERLNAQDNSIELVQNKNNWQLLLTSEVLTQLVYSLIRSFRSHCTASLLGKNTFLHFVTHCQHLA